MRCSPEVQRLLQHDARRNAIDMEVASAEYQYKRTQAEKLGVFSNFGIDVLTMDEKVGVGTKLW